MSCIVAAFAGSQTLYTIGRPWSGYPEHDSCDVYVLFITPLSICQLAASHGILFTFTRERKRGIPFCLLSPTTLFITLHKLYSSLSCGTWLQPPWRRTLPPWVWFAPMVKPRQKTLLPPTMKQFVSQCQSGQFEQQQQRHGQHTYPPPYLSVHPHTLTALALLLAWLFYAAVRTNYEGTETSVKLGISAAMGCFVFIGMLQFRDGPFIRPSIPFWRAVLSLSVLYQLLLVFLLFLVSTIMDDPSSSFSIKMLTTMSIIE